MNPAELLWLALQTTLLALSSLLLVWGLARRSPAWAARVLTTSLGGSLALTVLAFCPLPAWWSWGSAEPAPAPREVVQPEVEVPPPSIGVRASAVLAPLLGLRRNIDPTPAPGIPWSAALPWVVLAGSLFLLGRLLLGLWAVARCRARSSPLVDAELGALVEELRGALGGTRPVALGESALVGVPATVGWWRPMVLLPLSWRTWSREELRAALAHELAHVRRGDYLLGLVARLALVCQPYHLLLHWLAAQLRWQQELAADDLAASVIGGRNLYLRSLARLALRLDGQSTSWPVPTLFSVRCPLIRRIRMLQVQDGRSTLPRRWGLLLVAAVALVVLALSAVRNPLGAAAPPAAPVPSAPLELSYLPGTPMGVVGIRPAAVATHPALAKFLAQGNAALADTLRLAGVPAGVNFRIEEVEQVVLTCSIKTDPKAKEGQTNFLLQAPGVMRMRRAYDWKGFLKALLPDTKEKTHQGRRYFKLPETAEVRGMLGGLNLCCFLPDDRTIVLDSEESVRKLLSREPGELPARPWLTEWQRLEGGLVAVAIDNRDGRWQRELDARTSKDGKAGRQLMHNASWVVLGIGGENRVDLRLSAGSSSPKEREAVVTAFGDLWKEGRQSLAEEERTGQKPMPDALQGFLKQLLREPEVARNGPVVRVRATAAIDLATLIRALIEAEIER